MPKVNSMADGTNALHGLMRKCINIQKLMLYILKFIHVYIIAVYIGGAGQILLKTVHKHLFKFWMAIQINYPYTPHYLLFTSIHIRTSTVEVLFFREKTKEKMVNSQ